MGIDLIVKDNKSYNNTKQKGEKMCWCGNYLILMWVICLNCDFCDYYDLLA